MSIDDFEFFDGESPDIRLDPESEAFLDMFQLQTGLERGEAISKIMNVGTLVFLKLLEAAGRGDGNPRIDFVIRDRNLSNEPVSNATAFTLDLLLHPENYSH